MKRGFLAGLITAAVLAMLYAGSPKPGPAGEIEPSATPVLSGPAKLWEVGGVPVAYYQHVTMPDGTRPQIKIQRQAATLAEYKALAPTTQEWQILAQNCWNAAKLAELNAPKPCTRCGGTGVEPQ